MTRAQQKTQPRECSARIENGRMQCDCLTTRREIRAPLEVCHPRMVELMTQLNAGNAEVTP